MSGLATDISLPIFVNSSCKVYLIPPFPALPANTAFLDSVTLLFTSSEPCVGITFGSSFVDTASSISSAVFPVHSLSFAFLGNSLAFSALTGAVVVVVLSAALPDFAPPPSGYSY